MSGNKAKNLIVVYSYHHNSTEKIANAIAKVIHADAKSPDEVNADLVADYDLVGFGTGIDSSKHYPELLSFVDELKQAYVSKCFVFSTSAVQGEKKVKKDHSCLINKLRNK